MMSIPGKPPRLPFDILTTIAQVTIATYRDLLALPRFGRRSLWLSFQQHNQNYITIHIIIYRDRIEDVSSFSSHRRYTVHCSNLSDCTTCPGIINYPNNEIEEEVWSINKHLHRLNGPAGIRYDYNRQKDAELWYFNGKRHRIGGYAHIDYDSIGRVIRGEYYLHDKRYSKKNYEAKVAELIQQ
jgi:hypothetical protein